MAPKKTLLQKMTDSPTKGWSIADIKKLCKENDIIVEPPSNGSHYKIVSSHLLWHLTVPYKRPIKVIYIKKLVGYVLEHQKRIKQQTMLLESKDKDNERL